MCGRAFPQVPCPSVTGNEGGGRPRLADGDPRFRGLPSSMHPTAEEGLGPSSFTPPTASLMHEVAATEVRHDALVISIRRPGFPGKPNCYRLYCIPSGTVLAECLCVRVPIAGKRSKSRSPPLLPHTAPTDPTFPRFFFSRRRGRCLEAQVGADLLGFTHGPPVATRASRAPPEGSWVLLRRLWNTGPQRGLRPAGDGCMARSGVLPWRPSIYYHPVRPGPLALSGGFCLVAPPDRAV